MAAANALPRAHGAAEHRPRRSSSAADGRDRALPDRDRWRCRLDDGLVTLQLRPHPLRIPGQRRDRDDLRPARQMPPPRRQARAVRPEDLAAPIGRAASVPDLFPDFNFRSPVTYRMRDGAQYRWLVGLNPVATEDWQEYDSNTFRRISLRPVTTTGLQNYVEYFEPDAVPVDRAFVPHRHDQHDPDGDLAWLRLCAEPQLHEVQGHR